MTPISPGNDGHGWNHLPPDTVPTPAALAQIEGFKLAPDARVPNDVEFFRSLIADLVGRGIADPQHIYMAEYQPAGS